MPSLKKFIFECQGDYPLFAIPKDDTVCQNSWTFLLQKFARSTVVKRAEVVVYEMVEGS